MPEIDLGGIMISGTASSSYRHVPSSSSSNASPRPFSALPLVFSSPSGAPPSSRPLSALLAPPQRHRIRVPSYSTDLDIFAATWSAEASLPGTPLREPRDAHSASSMPKDARSASSRGGARPLESAERFSLASTEPSSPTLRTHAARSRLPKREDKGPGSYDLDASSGGGGGGRPAGTIIGC
eukprot:1341762-Rhodomonas_salina.2